MAYSTASEPVPYIERTLREMLLFGYMAGQINAGVSVRQASFNASKYHLERFGTEISDSAIMLKYYDILKELRQRNDR